MKVTCTGILLNDKITLHWERVGQILSHFHSSITGTLQRLFGGTKHHSPDSVGTYSSRQFSSLIQESIFGTEVTCFKIGDDEKEQVLGCS